MSPIRANELISRMGQMLKACSVWVFFVAVFLAVNLAHAKPDRVVFGYSAVWRDEANPPSEYNYEGMTYLARSFLRPLPDGSVSVPEGFFNPTVEKVAHQHDVKILMSVGGGDINPADWLSIATRPQNLQRFVDKIDQLMTENHFDGVDIDWEPPDPTLIDGQSHALMLKTLRAKLPHAIITTALPTDEYQTRFIVWPDVVASVDYVNAMSYDYSGPWTGFAWHASNLFPAGDYASPPGHSAAEGMLNLIQNHHVPPAKLLMGVTFWGYRFRVDKIGGQFTPNAPDVSDDLSYQQTQNLMATGHYKLQWDEKAAIPYLLRTGGGSVVCFENPDSIRRKCYHSKNLGCAGIMIWGMGADMGGMQAPLMDAVVQATGGERSLMSRAALEAEITETQEMIKRESRSNEITGGPKVPAALSGINVDQLESLNAQLQWREGSANDAMWQSQSPSHRH